MGPIQQTRNYLKIAVATFVALLSIGLFGINPSAVAQNSQFSISDKSFNQRPTHITSDFIEYESLDRSYAVQKIQSGSSETWQLPLIQGLSEVRVNQPTKIAVGTDTINLRDRRGIESVAEYLLRHLILHIDTKDLTSVTFDRNIEEVATEANQKKIWNAYRELKARGIEANAFNLFVRYADTEMTRISEVIYELTPQNPNARSTIAKSIPEMIGIFSNEISEVLKSGYFPYKTSLFAENQKNEAYVSRKNVAGRDLRIAGVDENYEKFLTQSIRSELKILGYDLAEAYFFGSRVITRDVLLQVDPSLAGNLDVAKGKLVKNHVREGGLTSVSDMEIFLVVKPLTKTKSLSETAQDALQLELRDQLRDSLNKLTRRYSLGMKMLIVDKDSSRNEYFSTIQKELWTKKGWLVSPEQYAKFYPPVQSHKMCSKVFLGH